MSILNVSGDNSMLAFANFSIFDAIFENLHIQIYVENSPMSLTKKPLFAQTSTSLKLSLLKSLRKKCPYLEFFWSASYRIRTKYGNLLCKSPYSVRKLENLDQKNSKYGHFLHSDRFGYIIF